MAIAERFGEMGVELSKTMLLQSMILVKEHLKEIWKWFRENEIAREGGMSFEASGVGKEV